VAELLDEGDDELLDESDEALEDESSDPDPPDPFIPVTATPEGPRLVAQTPFYAADTANPNLVVPLPAYQPGDILIAIVSYHVPDYGAQPPLPSAPAGWAAPSTAMVDIDSRGWVGIMWTRAIQNQPTPTFPRPAVSSPIGNTIFAVSVTVWRGLIETGEPWDPSLGATAMQTASGGLTAGFGVAASDRLGVAIVIATYANLTGGAIPGWDKTETRIATGRGATAMIFQKEVGSNPGGMSLGLIVPPPASPAIRGYAAISFALIPAELSPISPAVTNPANLRLQCSTEYTVFITSNDYRTPVGALEGFSDLKWSRVLDEISEARVVVPDRYGGVRCMTKYGGLLPWRYGLLIECNGQEVWSGPVTGVARQGASIVVDAKDVLSRYQKRLATFGPSITPELQAIAGSSYVWTNNDAGTVFRELIEYYATHPQDAWTFEIPEVNARSPISRRVVARDFEMAWDVAQELLDSALDGYVMNGKMILYEPYVGWRTTTSLGETVTLPGPYNAAGDFVYGLFTNDAFKVRPDWSINGYAQANRAWVPGADSGEDGFRRVWAQQNDAAFPLDGVLDMVETATLYRGNDDDSPISDSVFQRHADSLIAMRGIAPAVIPGVVLADGAPIDRDNLRPGSIWTCDVWDAGWGQLLQAVRVKRIEVNVRPVNGSLAEEISCTLFPVGYTEDE
jgi:hypothetical protein